MTDLVDTSVLTDKEMDAELEKGFADIAAGRTKTAESVFESIRKLDAELNRFAE